jgi:hypothetical protein
MRRSARLLLTGRRPLELLPYQHVNCQVGVARAAASTALVGVKWGQEHAKQAAGHMAAAQTDSDVVKAGGTGIEPATCGCGACCRSLREAQGRTRRSLTWPISRVHSVRMFTRVHRRWGQNWGQAGIPGRSKLVWTSSSVLVTWAAAVVKWTASLPTLRRFEDVIGGAKTRTPSTPAKASVNGEGPSKN